MNLTTASDGRINLHIWRTGITYEQQKGAIYRKEWNNILFSVLPQPQEEKEILYYDIRQLLPYPNNTFDAVFALHIIEHLTPAEGESFVKELFRVLKPNGIVRLSTPDLEDVCRNYLQQLEANLANPSQENLVKYDWAVLELLDQLVRDKSGGLMVEAIKNNHYDPEYSKTRYGDVFEEFYLPPPQKKKSQKVIPNPNWKQKIKNSFPVRKIKGAVRKINSFYQDKTKEKHQEISQNPRKSKEINLWMYDRLSLQRLLNKIGFREITQQSYKSSQISNWEKYNFDQSNFGDNAIEPSLYMEGKKPSNI